MKFYLRDEPAAKCMLPAAFFEISYSLSAFYSWSRQTHLDCCIIEFIVNRQQLPMKWWAIKCCMWWMDEQLTNSSARLHIHLAVEGASSLKSCILESICPFVDGKSFVVPSTALSVINFGPCLTIRSLMNKLQILDIGGKADADVFNS